MVSFFRPLSLPRSSSSFFAALRSTHRPRYRVVLQAAVRSDRSTGSWISRRCLDQRHAAADVKEKGRGFRDRATFAPPGYSRRCERRPGQRCTSTSDLTRTHRAITFNLCSSRSLNRQTFGDRPRGPRASLKYIYMYFAYEQRARGGRGMLAGAAARTGNALHERQKRRVKYAFREDGKGGRKSSGAGGFNSSVHVHVRAPYLP